MNHLIVLSCLFAVCAAAPGLLYSVPHSSSDTRVVRDFLGNQATAYSYQSGHTGFGQSSVAVSRNDVSKHLVAAPVVAAPVAIAADPVVYAASPYHYQQAYAAPAYTYGTTYGHYPAYASPYYF